MPHDLAEALQQLLGPDGAGITSLQRLSGGASRETWSFDLVAQEEVRPLILQRLREVGGAGSTGVPMGVEAELLRVASRHGVPVAEVVASDDGSVLGRAGMVVTRLEGETIPRKLLRDDEWAVARRRLGGQVGAALAAVHAIPTAEISGLGTTDQLAQFRGILDALGEPHPAFELGFRWLEAHRPAPTTPTVVHGDFRLGNLLVDHDGLRAVLDWELAHLGDPLEDLGWFCVRAWRFGSPLPAGGVASREQLVSAYEAASGRTVDVEALRWWELLGTLKWGVICIMQAWGHLSGGSRSVELATIGRRVCENEWDVLGLLPGPVLVVDPPVAAVAVPALHDRPHLAELVEAVREWVDGDVREGTDGRLAFHARVAANALRMVERELAQGPGPAVAHRAALVALGCQDDADLATQIRGGGFDDRLEEVRTAVAASVVDKLRVANPTWLSGES